MDSVPIAIGMSNHAHLIISAKENNVSDVLGDFKKFTSKQIIKVITEHPGESRREWMLKMFKESRREKQQKFKLSILAAG